MMEPKDQEKLEEKLFNLTDVELDDLLKEAMRKKGYKTFINYMGEEEVL